MDRKILDFLAEAKKMAREAGRIGKIEPKHPNAYDFEYKKDDLTYYDSCFGSGKFVGVMAIWKKDLPIWAMNYTGRIVALGAKEGFLNAALEQMDEEMPLRGPESYKDGEYEYNCNVEGDMKWFSGREEMLCNGKLVYEMSFSGGEILD